MHDIFCHYIPVSSAQSRINLSTNTNQTARNGKLQTRINILVMYLYMNRTYLKVVLISKQGDNATKNRSALVVALRILRNNTGTNFNLVANLRNKN
jgi:hypothetical protein